MLLCMCVLCVLWCVTQADLSAHRLSSNPTESAEGAAFAAFVNNYLWPTKYAFVCARAAQPAATAPVQGICTGDSGGPLVYRKKPWLGSAYYVQVGVVSQSSTPCNAREPKTNSAVFTRVSLYLGWINTVATGWDRIATPAVIANGDIPSSLFGKKLTIFASLRDATGEAAEVFFVDGGVTGAHKTVWFQLTSYFLARTLTIETIGSATDTTIQVFTSTDMTVPVYKNDDGAVGNKNAKIDRQPFARSTTYMIQVDVTTTGLASPTGSATSNGGCDFALVVQRF